MAKKYFVIDGFSYSLSNTLVSCTVTFTGTPSNKIKANGTFVCLDEYSASITNITVPSTGATTPDPGPYTVNFSATSTKNKDLNQNKFILRVDDKTNLITATPYIPGSPSTPYPVTFYLYISNAGQSKVLGE